MDKSAFKTGDFGHTAANLELSASAGADGAGKNIQKPSEVAPSTRIEESEFENTQQLNAPVKQSEIQGEITIHTSPAKPNTVSGGQIKTGKESKVSSIEYHTNDREEGLEAHKKESANYRKNGETKTGDSLEVEQNPQAEGPSEEDLISDLYHKHVPSPLSCNKGRKEKTLALFKGLGVKPKELEAFLEQTKNWQSGRVWGQGLTVFTAGFFLMSAFNYANATHGFKFSGDPEVNKLASFLMSCVIAGCGGVFGSNIITKGGLEPKYFDTKWKKDSKLVPYLDTVRGKLVEYSSFWGFSVGHSLVEVAFKNREDPVAKAAAKWASACAATFMTCLHKQMMPPLLLLRDPMLLDASTPQKEQAVSALIAEMRKENPTPVSDYMKQWGRGLKATLGIPSTTQLVRALIHTFMVVIALSGMLASQSSSNHAYELAIAGSVAIGLIWGAGSRASRAAIQEIEQNAVRLDRAQSNKGRQIEVVSEAVSSRVNDVAPRDDNKS